MTQVFVKAYMSPDPIVSGATRLLQSEHWPNKLLIFGNSYLQYALYTDSTNTLNWIVIVLLPASIELDHISPQSTYYIPMIVTLSIALFVIVASFLLLVLFRGSRIMQLSQPIFSYMVILGCLCLCISCLQLLGPNTTQSCGVRAYMLIYSFTVAFSPLLIKCMRTHWVFVRRARGPPVVPVRSQSKPFCFIQLSLLVAILLIFDTVIISATLYSGGSPHSGFAPYSQLVKTTNGAYADLSKCAFQTNYLYIYALLCYKGALISTACYYSFRIRNVADGVAGVRVLAAVVYNTFFACGVVMYICWTSSSIELKYFTLTVGVAYCVVLWCALQIGSLIFRVLTRGDEAAAHDVILQLFGGRYKNEVSVCVHTVGVPQVQWRGWVLFHAFLRRRVNADIYSCTSDV